MAQDFHAVFGLGDDDRSYSAVDGHGVALAAIQALDRLAQGQQAQIERLERANRTLTRRLRAMEQRVQHGGPRAGASDGSSAGRPRWRR
jgi:hypothetical protein